MDSIRDMRSTNRDGAMVDMSERQTRLRSALLDQVEDYWTALRGTRLLPLRSEIDPRGLKGVLEYCFVLERIAPGIARMRVAGSHLGELMGMEVRGMPISSFLTGSARQEFGEMLEEVFETPATASVMLRAETGFGRPPMRAQMILLPVRDDAGGTTRVMGAMVAEGRVGDTPRQFDIETITSRPVVPSALTNNTIPARLVTGASRSHDCVQA